VVVGLVGGRTNDTVDGTLDEAARDEGEDLGSLRREEVSGVRSEGWKGKKGEDEDKESEKETNIDNDGILDVGDVLVLTLSDLNLKAVRRRGSA
jgi:hypothetical protein